MAEPGPPTGEDDRLGRAVRRRAQRKRAARRSRRRTVWFGLGLFGLVGWSVALPTLLGIGLGVWLDRRSSGTASWTLTFMIVGVALGCFNAWHWIKQEIHRD